MSRPEHTDEYYRLTGEMRALAEEYLAKWREPLAVIRGVYPKLYKAARIVMDDEEIRSAAWSGLVRAAFKFDPTRGVLFSTVANLYLRRHVQGDMEWRMAACRGGRDRHVSGDMRVDSGHRRPKVLWDLIPDPSPDATERRDRLRRMREMIGEAIRFLDPKYAEVVRMRYGLGDHWPMTFIEIGTRIGKTKQRAKQIHDLALVKIRERLAADGRVGVPA